MASQNYGSASLDVLDERFYIDSKTSDVVNKGMRLDFNGKNSVTIYNVDTVPESDYIRSGRDRFGALVELGTGTQTFTLSQDKSFTFTVDRGNLEDSMMAQEVAKAVKRQVREVSVPTVDIYTLATASAYAVANSQGATTAITTANAYSLLIAQKAAMIDLLVNPDNIHVFLSQTNYNLLRQDPAFKVASDGAYRDVKSGNVDTVDGMTLHVVPASYMPTNVGYLFIADNVLVRPVKFDMVRTLDEVQGIDGWVAEGRRYYDVFIPTNKGTAIRYHKIA
jgi:hypothetical protein